MKSASEQIQDIRTLLILREGGDIRCINPYPYSFAIIKYVPFKYLDSSGSQYLSNWCNSELSAWLSALETLGNWDNVHW